MKMYLQFLLPQPGDTPNNIVRKLERMEEMVQSYKRNPGNALHETWEKVRAVNGLPDPGDDEFDWEE